MSRKTARNVPAKTQQQPQQQQQSALHQVAIQQSWHGPLPAPDQLAKFDQIVPGCAERIIRMAEEEGSHSREVQMRAVRATVRLQHIGQAMAFILSVAALYAAYILSMADHDWVAGGLVTSALVGLAAAFLKTRQEKN